MLFLQLQAHQEIVLAVPCGMARRPDSLLIISYRSLVLLLSFLSGPYLAIVISHPFMKNFDKRLFLRLVPAFLPVMILLILTHELGHYFAMRSAGIEARIHYWATEPLTYFKTTPTRASLIWITLSGPLVTIILGTIGFVMLFILKRRSADHTKLSRWQWAMVLLSLFWVRPVFGLFFWVGSKIGIYTQKSIGDETRLAWLLDLPPYIFNVSLIIIAIAIILIIIFRFIPRKQRITFIFSTITGFIISYFAWFKLLGKLLLP